MLFSLSQIQLSNEQVKAILEQQFYIPGPLRAILLGGDSRPRGDAVRFRLFGAGGGGS